MVLVARNPNIGSITEVREREEFVVNFARTRQYKESAIPFCQRLLNSHFQERREAEAGGGAGASGQAGAGGQTGPGAGAGQGTRGRSRRAGGGGRL